jgi:hypothetical protein
MGSVIFVNVKVYASAVIEARIGRRTPLLGSEEVWVVRLRNVSEGLAPESRRPGAV